MSRSRLPFLDFLKRSKTAPEIPVEPPIYLGNHSTGEYFHEATAHQKRIRKRVLDLADERARKLGVDRREFLASSAGMITTLAVINACSSDSSGGGGSGSGGSGGSGGTGGYAGTGGAAGMDCTEADEILDVSDYFIFDIQTHHVDATGMWRETNPLYESIFPSFFPQGSCSDEPDALACLGYDKYLDLIFRQSDTTMAVLSGFPVPRCSDEVTNNCGNPLDSDDIALSMQATNMLARSERMVNHCLVMPNDDLDFQLAKMERVHTEYGIGGFKAYTSWGPGGGGYHLDDEDTGIPMIEKAVEIGVPIICVHKGIPLPTFDQEHNGPRDLPVVAKRFPNVKFLIYHSNVGWNDAGQEGPYDASLPFEEQKGVDAMIKVCQDAGIEPGSNIYPELGTAFLQHVDNPVAAAHLIGKLMKYFGEDNVLWGSECIWMGSPQMQIEAFKALTISAELQESEGYPELTDERKRKILGLNAARVYGIDPEATRCKIQGEKLALEKRILDGELGKRRWALMQRPLGPRTRREYLQLARLNAALRQPG